MKWLVTGLLTVGLLLGTGCGVVEGSDRSPTVIRPAVEVAGTEKRCTRVAPPAARAAEIFG